MIGSKTERRQRRPHWLFAAAYVVGTAVLTATAWAADKPDKDKIQQALQSEVPNLAQAVVTTTDGDVWLYDFYGSTPSSETIEAKKIKLPKGIKPKRLGNFYLFVETGSFCYWSCGLENGNYRCQWKVIPPGGSC